MHRCGMIDTPSHCKKKGMDASVRPGTGDVSCSAVSLSSRFTHKPGIQLHKARVRNSIQQKIAFPSAMLS
jgi:hypothetical protein